MPEYNTKLTVGYRFDAIDRSNAQVGHSSTNTGSVAVSVGVRAAGQRQAVLRLCRPHRLTQLSDAVG
jgi:hypothetical protein